MNTLVFTCGDINGIGPEICIKSLNQLYEKKQHTLIFICPDNVFTSASSIVQPHFNYEIVNQIPKSLDSETIIILDIGKFKQRQGIPTKDSGKAAYLAIEKAFAFVRKNNSSAIITAPISKTAFKLAGKNYPGQTELLAEMSKSKKYLMVFLSDELICGLTTIHEPIKNVSKLITKQKVRDAIKVLYNTLRDDLGIQNPGIAVLGLNPHAGEGGNIGKEEINSIAPVIRSMKNISIQGPFVPDAFFGSQKMKQFNAVLGMYHDQVLIPFKLMNFNSGVNFTAGLPIIRTSPDHGTGYDIAGKGIANPQSMLEAARWANMIIDNRKLNRNES